MVKNTNNMVKTLTIWLKNTYNMVKNRQYGKNTDNIVKTLTIW
jgi:hypothetical protein